MNEQEQRMAIAEACGWTSIANGDMGNQYDVPIGYYPNAQEPDDFFIIPDYLNDLNAMHEAEKVLYKKHWFTYCTNLSDVSGNREIRATATHRAEAFLKTLNLWED